ncbi:hypothetical protein VTJ83DRAFT_5174 [Remersonia thermophila]|uniref:Uncharacterized protein n=1 Tax=Remersonia thermophila TaxID=72144 RepID=A0ABR4DC96_9PEZI
MKFFTVLTLASAASAWTFVHSGGKVADGTGNKSCTKIDHKKGQQFSWDRATFSSCCIRLYSDSSCTEANQVGYSCSDWTKTASQNINGFRVTSC